MSKARDLSLVPNQEGADKVGYGNGSVGDALDARIPEVANYAAVRAGLGGLPAVYVRGRQSVFDGGENLMGAVSSLKPMLLLT